MSSYLAMAAAALERAAKDLDERPSGTYKDDREARLRIAEGYIALAAIERGLPPGRAVPADPDAGH